MNNIRFLISLVLLFVIFEVRAIMTPCIPINFGHGSIVCVCNSTYCDDPIQLKSLSKGMYFQVISSKEGQRFEVFIRNITKIKYNRFIIKTENSQKIDFKEVELIINRTKKFQNIIGFGGAFTDSAGINIASVTLALQKIIMESYYSDNGLGYSIGRIPMGGTDFSTRVYSYDDNANDTELKYFALAEEDFRFKIPFIKTALLIRPNLKLLAVPWSAPEWMKTNDRFSGNGFLKPEYYKLWAEYFCRFLEEYKKHNLTMWAVSAQNEPMDGQIHGFSFNCMGWTAEQQRDWIKNNLGPTLSKYGFENVKIIIFDDQRPILNSWIRTVLSDPEAAKYVSGIGLHWYLDNFPVSILNIAHHEFPDYFLLGTEACIGSFAGEHSVLLGSWERGESYAEDIIEDLNHWVTGWIDWNLVLDLNGGPNWVNNFVDAPIIVDNVTNVIYKQPIYYVIGHFSKYIPENSTRILTVSSKQLKGFEILTVLRPDGLITTVILNKLSEYIRLKIKVSEFEFIRVKVGPRSIQTIIF